jgi:hypothetical protein
VDVLGRHVVHRHDQRHVGDHLPIRREAPRMTRVAPVAPRAFAANGNRLHRLPVRQRAQARVGADQVQEMCRAGARHARDDQRPLELHIEDLRVTPQEILEAQPVGRVAHEIREGAEPSERVEPRVLLDRLALQRQARAEIIVPEFGEFRALRRRGEDRLDAELHRLRLRVRNGLRLRARQRGLREVGDADLARRRHAASPSLV